MHGKPAEINTTALDAFLSIDLEAVALKEWPCCKTNVAGNFRDTDRTQCGLDALVEAGGNTATGERGMSEKKVEVALLCVGSEARENAVRLGDDRIKRRETLLPTCGVGWNWCQCGDLLRRVERRGQRANRNGVDFQDARQIGWLIWSIFHKGLGRSANEFFALRLPRHHRAKEKDQHADGHERERGAREKLRYAIETLTAPGLHECDQGQNEPDTVTAHRDRGGGLRGPTRDGTRKRTAHQTEPKK